MAEQSRNETDSSLQAQVEHLELEVSTLQQDKRDLELALLTITEHGDLIEAEMHRLNEQLKGEITERQKAQAALQDILERVSQDKADLEIILQATAEHGDTLEYQLYTQAVESMRQSEALFRAIAESTPILMILAQALDGSITYANSVSSERLCIESQDLIGQRLLDFFTEPVDADYLDNQLHQVGYVRNYEMRLRDRTGHPFWVSTSIHPLTLNGQHILLTTLYDISDRKHAELLLQASEEQLRKQAQELELHVAQRTIELQQAEAKYRDIFENAAEGIFQVSPQGRYLSANPALAKLLGYETPADLMTHLTDIRQQLYIQPQRWDELMTYLNHFGTVAEFESQIYRQDGSILWISENIRPVYDDRGNLLYYEGSIWDITQRKVSEEALRQQRQTSDRLLLNVLPQPIAERLKRGQKTIADQFDDASVLFADIVNFTGLSTQTHPERLVTLLNDIFSAFDNLADYYHLEKIKTIGDAYMVVGGLPTPQADPLGATADMALDMLQTIQTFYIHDQPIHLRIGIHTGPVIAGVIGARKFIYDLWGDTVNLASRMESQGEAGRIQVTEAVYLRLKKRYRFKLRGSVDIKGTGNVTTYWLLSRKVNLKF